MGNNGAGFFDRTQQMFLIVHNKNPKNQKGFRIVGADKVVNDPKLYF